MQYFFLQILDIETRKTANPNQQGEICFKRPTQRKLVNTQGKILLKTTTANDIIKVETLLTMMKKDFYLWVE